MTMAEDYRKLRDWILENAGLEAKSMPVAIQILWMMDRARWEVYAREHTLSTWEEGVELVLSYLEAAVNETAAQVAGPPAEGECLLSPSPPAEGECLLSPSPPAERECLLSPYPPADGECLLVLPPQPKWEEPEHPQPKSMSTDYGTTYTKLNLLPGTTIVVTNFYICPTNKKKRRLQQKGPTLHVQSNKSR
ncbi:UNVERIFIED_CONTAM: hypothetical protein FKN15_060038 [Acipenser sinensis]